MYKYDYVVNTFKNGEPVLIQGSIEAESESDAIKALVSSGVVYPNGYEFLELKATHLLAEWKMVVDDYDEGWGHQKYPHCSNCKRGVYRHDAGSWCPFCGAAMKNPMR